MARFCLSPGCPEVLENKSGYCIPHDPWLARPAWQNRRSAAARGNGWAWGDLRRRVLRRDSGRCRSCGRSATEVDHIVPIAECLILGVNAHELSNLQSLCVDCHRSKSEVDRIAGMRRKREKRNGYEDDKAQRSSAGSE